MKFTYDFHDTTGDMHHNGIITCTKYNSTEGYASSTAWSNPVDVPFYCSCYWNGKVMLYPAFSITLKKYDLIFINVASPLTP